MALTKVKSEQLDAAQTNITSVGTLIGLTVSGDLTVDTTTLKVDSSSNRVGIGTTSPPSLLSVGTVPTHTPGSVFTSSPSSFFSTTTLGGTTGNDQKITIFGGGDASNVSGLALYRYRRATGTNWTTDGFSFRQEVDGTANIYNYMNFAGGNVGIGTTSPSAKLDVLGNVKVASTNSPAKIFFRDSRASSNSEISQRSDGRLSLAAVAGSYATTGIEILANGNVGIGTASPSTKLHIGGTAPGDSIIRQDSTVSGTNWEIGERAAGKWQIFEDDGDSIVATFMSTGNVGIGTQLPQAAKFSGSAVGILELAGTKPVINIHETDVTDAEFFMGMSGGTAFLGTTGDGILAFSTGTSSASEAMRIDSNGGIILSNHYWLNNDVFKVYNITGPSSSSFTRTIDVNSYWGYAAQGGFFMYAIHGWQGDEAAGLIAWSNAGNSSQVIVNVFHREFFTPTFTSVTATKGSGDREIDITINGAHVNTHGWRWVVWA